MKKNRRSFLAQVGVFTLTGFSLPTLARQFSKDFSLLSASSSGEDYWRAVRQAYTVSAQIINLNNGGVSPQPLVVQEAVERYNQLSNEAPTYYMWRTLDAGREPLRERLAQLAGCSAEEIAIQRNTTECLETIIFGLRLQKGDEVVLTKQDYPNMINAWKQRAMRDGIVLKFVNLQLPSENEDELVKAFTEQFTKKTRVVMITHMINWNGQLLPAAKIADAAHKIGAEVVVDMAHTFAHINFKITDLRCDYAGTSLHKWLCAPFGSGMLYVKKEKIANLYPIFSNDKPESDDIRKYEVLGTRSLAIEQAIGQAIDFHETIGAERKQNRLHFLKTYWTEKAAAIPKIKIHTPSSKNYSGALALFSIEGKKPTEIVDYLFNTHKIHTVAIEYENINGVRVTPHIYTQLRELDKFVKALEMYVKQ
jgi:selenocysteine lyase/cysteine desulfurase